MKNFVLMIVFLTSTFVFGQISKSASIRDFGSFKEYRYFLEYKDSLNKINNVKLDIEYLEEFKKIYKRTDSLNQVDLKERDQLEKEEYIRETKLEKYLGTYFLSKVKDHKFYSYNAKMYIFDTGITVLFNDKFNDDLRLYYNFEIRRLLKSVTYSEGRFYLKDNQTDLIVLSFDKKNESLTITIDKKTYIFKVDKFIKE